MAKKPEQPTADDARALSDLAAALGRQVLRDLGSPSGLHLVQVRHLWGNHYRANVFVGPDAASACVAHSYFLVADAEGKIAASTPCITRMY
jgi:hypothetical protein